MATTISPVRGRKKVHARLSNKERRRRNTGIATEATTLKLPTDVLDRLHAATIASGRNNVSWEVQVILDQYFGIEREG